MIIDYDGIPSNSLFFLASKILFHLKNGEKKISSIMDKMLIENININLVYLSFDWLYLIGMIKQINDKGEIIV